MFLSEVWDYSGGERAGFACALRVAWAAQPRVVVVDGVVTSPDVLRARADALQQEVRSLEQSSRRAASSAASPGLIDFADAEGDQMIDKKRGGRERGMSPKWVEVNPK